MVKEFIFPKKIVFCFGRIENAESLLKKKELQIGLIEQDCATFYQGSSIMFDFGKEFAGGVRILTHIVEGDTASVRIRFGESLSEACSEIGEKGATNNHSLRDIETKLVSYSDMEFGQTGYRFIRLDFLSDVQVKIKSVLGIYEHTELQQVGTFRCNDEELNQIFDTAAYTLNLCIHNNMLWDGIKRDRLVWIEDMHPETMSFLYLFDDYSPIKNSLTFVRDQTPLPGFMNRIPSYSLWWIIILEEYYRYTGDIDFLKANKNYLADLLRLIDSLIDENGEIKFPETPEKYFLDWATFEAPERRAGVYGLCAYALKRIMKTASELGIDENSIQKTVSKINSGLSGGKWKQVLAMQILGGHIKIKETLPKLLKNRTDGFSTFMSYYILAIIFEGGKKQEAIALLKEYFGAMISKGATTFWEDFNIKWSENSCRIDELPHSGQLDIHGDFGKFCYTGFRHSLCHGWSSSPVAFIMKYILGIHVLRPGFQKVKISPSLCGLSWVEGRCPTPFGAIDIKAEMVNSEVKIDIKAPKEIEFETEQENESKIAIHN